MNEVIICGLRYVETLCAVEHFLDDKYHIIGYADVDPEMNWLDGDVLGKRMPFYTLEQLERVSFDWIVLPMFDESQSNELIEKLQDLYGREVDKKIIIPTILNRNSIEKHQEDTVRRIRNTHDNFYGVILGLSYSLRGIDKNLLCRKFFDLSWHGRDLYYNLQLLKYAFKIGKFSDIKAALLVFPYYYFEYDQSRSYYQYKSGQMFGVYELDDWHNADRVTENGDEIFKYITNYRMFGKKIFDWYHGGYYKKLQTVYQGELKDGKLPKSFFADRPATVEENLKIFADLINILNNRGVRIILVIPPIFIDGLDEESSKNLKMMKEKFYFLVREVTCKSKINLDNWDLTEIFSDKRSMFSDLTHVNIHGSPAFTQKLNDLLIEKKVI